MHFKLHVGLLLVWMYSGLLVTVQSEGDAEGESDESHEEERIRRNHTMPKGRASTTCDSIQFDTYTIGDVTTVYVSKGAAILTWYDAVCCCRSRGQYLLSPTSAAFMDSIKRVLPSKNFGWADIRSHEGTWRHLLTGEKVASEIHTGTTVPIAQPEMCVELTTQYRVLPLSCGTKYNEDLICEKRKTTPENCYPIGLDPIPEEPCNTESIQAYAKENICPRRVITTTAGPTTTEPPTTAPTQGVEDQKSSSCSSCCNFFCWCDFLWNLF